MKKKILIVSLVIVLLLVLIGGGFAFAYFFTDAFKSNKELFGKYIAKNEKILEIFKDEDIKNYAEKQKSTPYSTNGTIKTNITLQDATNTSLVAALQNCNISFDGKVDNVNKYSYKNIKANYSDTQSLSMELVQNNDIYAVKVNDVINKFVGIQNSNLKEFAKKMGADEQIVSTIPNKIDLSQMQAELSTQAKSFEIFSEEEFEEVKNKYIKIITDNLTDEMFTKDKQNDNVIYTLTINENTSYKILTDLLASLKEDEMVLNKIKTFIVNNLKISDQDASGYINNLKELVQSEIDSLSQKTVNDKDVLKINVYSKKRDLEKTEFAIPSTNENEYKLLLINAKNGGKIEVNYEQDIYSISFQKNKTENDIEYNFSLAAKDNNLAELNIKFDGINTDQVKEISEFTIENYLLQMIGSATNMLDISNTKLVYKYENTKNFSTQISKEDINNNVLLLNTAPNADSVKNLINQIGVKLEQVNEQKMIAAGLQNVENPFEYYIPAIVPVGATYITTRDIKIDKNLMNPIYTILGGTASIVLNSANSVLQQQDIGEANTNSIEIQTFNSQWEVYAGTSRSASYVRTLVSEVIANNNSNNNHKVTVNNEFPTEMPTLEGSKSYTIILNYDSSGYVNGIIYN